MNNKKIMNPALEKILNETGLPYFLMAVSHLMDVGYRHMTEDSVKETIEGIKKQDDKGKLMTNAFTIYIVETAYKISQTEKPIELAKFVGRHVK